MIKLEYDNVTQLADIVIDEDTGNIAIDEGLETAVLISLFTERRASVEDLPVDELDRNGWWGDTYAEEAGDFIGSRLWLLRRGKATADTLGRAREYAKEALEWLIEDGIAEDVEVEAFWQGFVLMLTVKIKRPNEVAARWARTWEAQRGL